MLRCASRTCAGLVVLKGVPQVITERGSERAGGFGAAQQWRTTAAEDTAALGSMLQPKTRNTFCVVTPRSTACRVGLDLVACTTDCPLERSAG